MKTTEMAFTCLFFYKFFNGMFLYEVIFDIQAYLNTLATSNFFLPNYRVEEIEPVNDEKRRRERVCSQNQDERQMEVKVKMLNVSERFIIGEKRLFSNFISCVY